MKTVWSIGWKLLLALFVVGGVVSLGSFRSFSMSSGSMIPTLWTGDYLAVSTTAYGISKYSLPGQLDLFEGRLLGRRPRRGDVVVFALPRDPKISYIKRVIGLPGDKVQVKEGRLLINGAVVPREPTKKVRTEDMYGQETEVATYKETLPGGTSHTIIEMQGDKGFNDNTEVFAVPADAYFMMGDNRDNSTDSRVLPEQGGVGYVPFANLIGRVELVLFSSAKNAPAGGPVRRVH